MSVTPVFAAWGADTSKPWKPVGQVAGLCSGKRDAVSNKVKGDG